MPDTPQSHAAATRRGDAAVSAPPPKKKGPDFEDKHPFLVFSFPLYCIGCAGNRIFVGGGGGGINVLVIVQPPVARVARHVPAGLPLQV